MISFISSKVQVNFNITHLIELIIIDDLHTLTKTRLLYYRAFKVELDCPLAQSLFIYFDYIYRFHNDNKITKKNNFSKL